MISEILFWLAVFLVFHSYVLYPLILNLMARGKKDNDVVFRPDEELPFVSIIMSVYNEEAVIVEKIKSIFYTSFPIRNLEVLIGSDASTDGTARICEAYAANYQQLKFYPFLLRQGKPSVINSLAGKARGEILILTDAKVFFDLNTIFELVRHFKNKEIDIIGGNIVNERTRKDGISIQEKAFMSREIMMKYQEGLIWSKTMGVYGAVYAIRKDAITKIPEKFTVDDFFITMNVIKNGKKAIMSLKAITREEVPNEINMEFRRKIRISAGNYQNLKRFYSLLWPPWSSTAFVLASHKVIRWTGPFILLMAFISSGWLARHSFLYLVLFAMQVFVMIIPLIDIFLRKFNIHIILLRFITHFYAMNIALLIGFFKNLFGLPTNIWQPTRR